MADRYVDVNCDLGETDVPWEHSHEPELLDLVSSANVACGGHAGDATSMRDVCSAAARRGVVVGAQVSYPDRENFGRVALAIGADALARSLEDQYAALAEACSTAGTRIAYVKPHGALYNVVVDDEGHALVVVELAARHGVALFGMAGSCTERLAQREGVRFVREWFADRGYLPTGRLAPRSRSGALVTSVESVFDRTVGALTHGTVGTLDGGDIGVDFRTICVHSDTPGAAALLRAVRDAVVRVGASVGPV